MDIDKWRMRHMALAEFFDAWRVIPRAIVAGYGYMLYWVIVEWYTNLAPYMVDGCVSEKAIECMVQAPTMEHTALVVTVVGISAPIMSFYVNTSKKWNGFTFWTGNKPKPEIQQTQILTEEKEKPLD